MGGFVSTILVLAYPIYSSFKALETEDKNDDTQWLTFWIIYGIFAVIEAFIDTVLWWFPLYPTAKMIFLIVLQIPQLNLAGSLYTKYVRPLFAKYEQKIDAAADEAKHKVSQTANVAKTQYDEYKKQ